MAKGGNAHELDLRRSAALPNGLKFVFGGTAGMLATFFVQPFDLVKNRMQLTEKETTLRQSSGFVIRGIIKKDGLLGLYDGLSAGLLRQATYTTTRLGVYNFLFDYLTRKNDSSPSFLAKAFLGIVAGAVGAIVGTPAELSLIRMTADGRLPLEKRRGYSNVFNALFRVVKEEGVATLWRGCGPTVIRAMVVNATQLATYSQSKQLLLQTNLMKDGIHCHFWASMISGLATTVTSMPVDMAKTQLQNMQTIDGRPEFRSALDVWTKVIKKEGILALWKGFTPYYFRLGPHTVLTFVFLEQMKTAYLNISTSEPTDSTGT
ncbi:Mitochondrial 2 oxoglutarate:malate [Trichuris trichiura]|uniref:Mitochondrial 2-oxoglutarate/malate carrier protein n=1 Tax=Trichuris trichiura TaxID=36087 RepID=A0A077ZF28_TRITR|nr:Mitochondrial 2 oxoglutarate:malate [Trichuris trichiura]